MSKLRYPFSHFYLVIAAHGQNALEHSILSTRTDMYNLRMRIKTRGVKVEVRWKWKSDGSGSAMEVAVNDPIGPSYFRFFSRHISRTQSQNRHIIFLALVALKLLVSLISRHVYSL